MRKRRKADAVREALDAAHADEAADAEELRAAERDLGYEEIGDFLDGVAFEGDGPTWVETPAGRFEIEEGTGRPVLIERPREDDEPRQVLGRVISEDSIERALRGEPLIVGRDLADVADEMRDRIAFGEFPGIGATPRTTTEPSEDGERVLVRTKLAAHTEANLAAAAFEAGIGGVSSAYGLDPAAERAETERVFEERTDGKILPSPETIEDFAGLVREEMDRAVLETERDLALGRPPFADQTFADPETGFAADGTSPLAMATLWEAVQRLRALRPSLEPIRANAAGMEAIRAACSEVRVGIDVFGVEVRLDETIEGDGPVVRLPEIPPEMIRLRRWRGICRVDPALAGIPVSPPRTLASIDVAGTGRSEPPPPDLRTIRETAFDPAAVEAAFESTRALGRWVRRAVEVLARFYSREAIEPLPGEEDAGPDDVPARFVFSLGKWERFVRRPAFRQVRMEGEDENAEPTAKTLYLFEPRFSLRRTAVFVGFLAFFSALGFAAAAWLDR